MSDANNNYDAQTFEIVLDYQGLYYFIMKYLFIKKHLFIMWCIII
jgi:hypothetical protein